jgi:hypothetical protein
MIVSSPRVERRRNVIEAILSAAQISSISSPEVLIRDWTSLGKSPRAHCSLPTPPRFDHQVLQLQTRYRILVVSLIHTLCVPCDNLQIVSLVCGCLLDGFNWHTFIPTVLIGLLFKQNEEIFAILCGQLTRRYHCMKFSNHTGDLSPDDL